MTIDEIDEVTCNLDDSITTVVSGDFFMVKRYCSAITAVREEVTIDMDDELTTIAGIDDVTGNRDDSTSTTLIDNIFVFIGVDVVIASTIVDVFIFITDD
jgi:hypothetical protein